MPTQAINANYLATAIIAALGIPTSRVASLQLDFEVGKIPIATIGYLVLDDQAEQLVEAFELHTIELKPAPAVPEPYAPTWLDGPFIE